MRTLRASLYDIHECDDEAGLFGQIEIFGVPHHVHFIEVRDAKQEDGTSLQEPVNDPFGRYEDLQQAYEGYYHAVEVPGFPGRKFAVMVVPHAD